MALACATTPCNKGLIGMICMSLTQVEIDTEPKDDSENGNQDRMVKLTRHFKND